MSETAWAEISQLEASAPLDAGSICEDVQTLPANPIDNFYSYLASVVVLGKDDELAANEALGQTLLLGIVSATEHYFRAVLSGLVHICPLARRQAASLTLAFGALEYYASEDLGLALLEHVSLATGGEVRKQTQRIVGIEIKKDSSADAAFVEYEKLCQLRHAAVHARGNLGHQNLQELGIAVGSRRLKVRVRMTGLHSAASVCQNVVRAYNRLLYRKTLERWMGEHLLSGKWNQDQLLFSRLFSLFYSKTDGCKPANRYLAYLSLRRILEKTLLTKIEEA